ncbi:MAG: DUF1801 domain-containing protein [Cytophagaceae bacterium]
MTVDEYIPQFPKNVQLRLKALRKLVKQLVPEAEESFSYQMPAYKFNKKPLFYFAAYEHHIGVYATPNTHEAFAAKLKGYKQGKGSVQFPLDEELPLGLIEEMILFRKKSLG